MTEARMQYECVKWFNNTYKQYRKCLIEINNNTNKGAHRKSMGQVAGASDLILCIPELQEVLFLELKLNGSTHKVEHLKRQFNFMNYMDNGFFTCFIFSVDHFKRVVQLFALEHLATLNDYCFDANDFIKHKLEHAEENNQKTIRLNYPDA